MKCFVCGSINWKEENERGWQCLTCGSIIENGILTKKGEIYEKENNNRYTRR